MKGLIGKYKLENWWNSEFTVDERAIIESVFTPMSSEGVMTGILTSGNIDVIGQTCLQFIFGLLSWFHKPEYYQIINKIVKLGDSMVNTEKDVLNKHSYFLHKIKCFYPCREQFPEAMELAIKACEEQINISNEAALAFKKENQRWTGKPPEECGLPEHTGFKQLCIIREKQGNWQEVIRLAEQAKSRGWNDGTTGGWDKRIEKARKKMEKTK
jgi:hypothetical protein